jgi:hypothetical protein
MPKNLAGSTSSFFSSSLVLAAAENPLAQSNKGLLL